MLIWAIERSIEEVAAELQSIQEALVDTHKQLRSGWQSKLNANAIAELNKRAHRLERRERKLELRLEKLYKKVQDADMPSDSAAAS